MQPSTEGTVLRVGRTRGVCGAAHTRTPYPEKLKQRIHNSDLNTLNFEHSRTGWLTMLTRVSVSVSIVFKAFSMPDLFNPMIL
jgi:hypothetical protein